MKEKYLGRLHEGNGSGGLRFIRQANLVVPGNLGHAGRRLRLGRAPQREDWGQ